MGPPKKKQKTQQTTTTCEICEITLNSDLQREQHYNGAKHMKKMKAKGVQSPATPNAPIAPNIPAEPTTPTTESNSSVSESNGNNSADNSANQADNSANQADNSANGSTSTNPVPTSPQKPTDGAKVTDPVAKAIYQNMLGTLPMTKKKDIPCEVCSMMFDSEIKARQHFDGQKHAKKVMQKEKLRYLPGYQQNKDGTTPSPVLSQPISGGALSCTFCNVQLNSIQQLEQHRLGKTHLKKVANASGKTAPNFVSGGVQDPTKSQMGIKQEPPRSTTPIPNEEVDDP